MPDAGKRGATWSGKAAGLAVVLALTAFFAVMWGVMLRAHLPTGGRARLVPNYESLLPADEQECTTTWGVYLGPLRIGKSVMKATREEDGTIRIRTDSAISVTDAAKYVVGVAGELDFRFEAAISPLRGPTFFQVISRSLNMDVVGTVEQNEIRLRGHVGEERVQATLPYDEGDLLGEALSPLAALPELREGQVGKQWTMEVMNPIAGRLEKVVVAVARSREVVLKGEAVRAFELTFTTGASRWSSWVTHDGQVLIQGTPFGLVIQRDDLSPQVVDELRREAESPTPTP